jgi:putative FmdB family regulatory protein
MPIYEYRRPNGTTFEVLQPISEDPLTVDPETGVPVERVLHAPAIHFKGKGFYNTDYGTRRRNREQQRDGDGSSGSSDKKDTKSSASSDAPAKADKPKADAKPAKKAS